MSKGVVRDTVIAEEGEHHIVRRLRPLVLLMGVKSDENEEFCV
jgi:hypothetical protein